MAKLISFSSWNVEHFKNSQSRAERCVSFLNDHAGPPDVFAIFEVEGKEVFEHFMALMPSHNFYLTEGPEVQETLVGIRKDLTAFVTQRHKLKSKVPTLRPGTLVTVHIAGANYSFLFLHVKSMRDPRGWGLRADMIEHALGLKKALDKRPGANPAANFIVLGDLNTMGLNVTDGDNDISGETELERFVRRFRRVDMDLMAKDEDKTWWGGATLDPSNLDHVFASDHLTIRGMNQSDMSVLGWPKESTTAKKKAWISKFSDHALLYGEIHT